MTLTQEQLKQRLHYDPETGVFTWLIGRKKGQPAGHKRTGGYLGIAPAIDGDHRDYLAHRLAWFYVHGQWPPAQIDHINGNRSDNRLLNLRLATNSQNLINRLAKGDTLGLRGIRWIGERKKWRAEIYTTIEGKSIRYLLGYFATREEAAAAYVGASKMLHREFRRAA